ncbi:MAG: hypothetical protein LIP08_08230 [Bacteroides sp.]|nr:hypothetical protein [Bacteroides sp.]
MKKFSIYVMAALALCLTACDDDYNKHIADPQAYPQENQQNIEGFTVSFDSGLSQGIVLDEATVEELTINIATVSATPDLSENQSTRLGRLQLATTSDFSDYIEVEAMYDESTLYISGEILDETVKSLYGKAAEERDIYMRVYIYIVEGSSASMIPTPAESGVVKVVPIQEGSYLWVLGDHQGWSMDNPAPRLSSNDEVVYEGFLYLNGGFKLTGENGWDDDDYIWGKGATDGLLESPGGNLEATPGFYRLVVDLENLTYEIIPATTWGIIGNATPGGWDNETPMTYDSQANTWSVTLDMIEGGEYKFRANNDWVISVGGSASSLIYNAGNLTFDQSSGNYTIVMYLENDLNSYCTITAN